MPSSGPQVNYFPSFQPIHQQNSYAPQSKWRTGCREVQSYEVVNKIKKKKLSVLADM
jgi:hypothetical protein